MGCQKRVKEADGHHVHPQKRPSRCAGKQMTNLAVKEWLQRLKVVVYDADDLVDEFATEVLRRQVETEGSKTREVRSFFSQPNSLKFRYVMGRKIKDIRERLDEIAKDMRNFDFLVRVVDRPVEIREREETYSFVNSSRIIGREGDVKAILQLLESSTSENNVQIIPIVGMGGLGKTTLAQLLYNDDWVARKFNRKLWVCVSDDFDVKKIILKILRVATKQNYDVFGIEELQIRLRELLDGEKFFLVLDDVWNEDPLEWSKLQDLLMVGAAGSRIVVTTRSKKVASIVGTVDPYELKGLSNEECLSLLVKCAFKGGQEGKHQDLVTIGREIVEKCGGVPLAVRSLGGMLYSRTNVNEWLSVRDSEIWTLVQKKSDIIPVLKLSYDKMPSHLKECFAYCSLFQKDEVLQKWSLIYQWMAQGFIESSLDPNKESEDIGEYYFDELVRMSFLEKYEDYGEFYKMHDLVHDLAQYVAGSDYLTVEQNLEVIAESVYHVSFGSCLYGKIPEPLLGARKLRTIRLQGCQPPNFVSKLLSSSRYLRSVDMSNKFSDSIMCWKHLRYLRLGGLLWLPDTFGNLLNLQYLYLSILGNHELPKDFGKLINLRYLLLSSWRLVRLPDEVIGRLTSLRKLVLHDNQELMSIGEGIRHLTCLRQLAIVFCPKLESLPSGMRYLTSLEHLDIGACFCLAFSEDDLQGLIKLKSLKLFGLPKLVSLPKGLQHAAASLNLLEISCCKNLAAVSESLPYLVSLQRLCIEWCWKLSSLPEGMEGLTVLHYLNINKCPLLSQRCNKVSGEDWHKIAHVQEIILDDTNLEWESPDFVVVPVSLD